MKDSIERRKFLKMVGVTTVLGVDLLPMNKPAGPITARLPESNLKEEHTKKETAPWSLMCGKATEY
jgi:hypothetical protein